MKQDKGLVLLMVEHNEIINFHSKYPHVMNHEEYYFGEFLYRIFKVANEGFCIKDIIMRSKLFRMSATATIEASSSQLPS